MARTFELRVVDPARSLLEVEEAQWVHARLVNGTGLTVYPGHAPLLAETIAAPLHYADGAGEHVFHAAAGILEVRGNEVSVFTSGEWKGETVPETSTIPEERRFKRLARELRIRLEEEQQESTLRNALDVGHEQT